LNRRTVLLGAAGLAAVVAAGGGGLAMWARDGIGPWGDAVKAVRRPITVGASGKRALQELVRFSTLAANSHNTQPWRFRLGETWIVISPDFSRQTPNVDPDNHHLFVGLGAATENIVQAAPMLGLAADAQYDPSGEGQIVIGLTVGPIVTSPLAAAITSRQCTRSLYDGRALPAADLAAVAAAAGGDEVEVLLLAERPAIDAVGALIIDGDTVQMSDPAYLAELKSWLRFGYADAVRTGDGLFSAATGNPVIPAMLGQLLFTLVATADSENKKYLAQIASSPGLAIFVSAHDDKAHWMAVGRAYQRFALQATALGIKHAFLNQAVEVAAVRKRLAAHLALGERRPDLIVRFGYASEMPWSMRRPVADVTA
jgi:nitroreductase